MNRIFYYCLRSNKGLFFLQDFARNLTVFQEISKRSTVSNYNTSLIVDSIPDVEKKKKIMEKMDFKAKKLKLL
jgi:hypothetical protein